MSASSCGSPPHAWGAPSPVQVVESRARFTPTRVGSTSSKPPCNRVTAVHPHTRGEHSSTSLSRSTTVGSPPHAWGARGEGVGRSRPGRFTPTRVGSTQRSCLCSPPRTVHPHTRGEHTRAARRTGSACGSPPHAWGAPLREGDEGFGERFTPTRVGSTYVLTPPFTTQAVHPHTRGEHHWGQVSSDAEPGSPPHTWGARPPALVRSALMRFTPTRVGSTGKGTVPALRFPVHPHTRGEHRI